MAVTKESQGRLNVFAKWTQNWNTYKRKQWQQRFLAFYPCWSYPCSWANRIFFNNQV